MLPLLSLHALEPNATINCALNWKPCKSHTRLATGPATTIEPIENESCSHAQDAVADVSVSELEADGSKANVSCFRGSGQ
jgi:hypothetical protein